MRRGTTPTITIQVPMDLTEYELHLFFKGKRQNVERRESDLDVALNGGMTTLTTTFTQAETLGWSSGETIKVQLRAKKGEYAIATNIASFSVGEILEDGII